MLLFLMMSLLGSAPTLAQVNLNAGLIGCYPFRGDARDLSPSQNHGKVTGATLAEDRFGNKDNAYYFDGQNDFIEIDAKILLLNKFSYSMWVSPEALPKLGIAFFLISVGSDYGDQHILLGNQYTNLRHNAFSHGSYQGVSQNVRCTNDLVPQTHKWYHLVLTKNIDNYFLYLDGKLVCSNPVAGKEAFYGSTTRRAMIGARNNYGQKTNARIDDIHLYNRALDEQEVLELFEGSVATDNVEITVSNSNPCAGEKVVASATVGSESKIKWAIDPAFILSQSANSLTLLFPDNKMDYEVIIKGETIPDSSNCFPGKSQSMSKSVMVKSCPTPTSNQPTLYIPSAFSPNGDGHNDDFRIFNWEKFSKFEIWIYGRWGEVIYYSENYLTAWDGKYNGQLVPPGTYVYKINSEKRLLRSGTVNIFF